MILNFHICHALAVFSVPLAHFNHSRSKFSSFTTFKLYGWFDMLSEQEIERWLDKQGVLIGYELHRIAIGEETALQQILKDGIVCCRIINCLIPNKIQKVSGEKSSEGFRENFQEFRKALGELGITPVSINCEQSDDFYNLRFVHIFIW